MMRRVSLAKTLMAAYWEEPGLIQSGDGHLFRCFECQPRSSGCFEEDLDGPAASNFYQKFSELLTRLPDQFEGQVILFRARTQENPEGFATKLLLFERVRKAASYAHLQAILTAVDLAATPLCQSTWDEYLSVVLGPKARDRSLPDYVWEPDCVRTSDAIIRTLSLTELPQTTWKACFAPVLEQAESFAFSLKFSVPERQKVRRRLETKRRVSHALSVTTSAEVQSIESNSVLHSSEETLERILIGKETLFEVSIAITLTGTQETVARTCAEFEKLVSGIGNAGLYREEVGSLPVLRSHLPGSKMLGVRTLPILSGNLADIFPLLLDYSTVHDSSSLQLRSRNGEICNLNFFSKENLNFNSFICGASGSGKSFLMNAILTALLKDDATTRLCIFDIGGSYSRIVASHDGRNFNLTQESAKSLLIAFLRSRPVTGGGFYRVLVETLCGSADHITHSHRVAIDDTLNQMAGEIFRVEKLLAYCGTHQESFYKDLRHWMAPYLELDRLPVDDRALEAINTQVSAFDFKGLDSNPVLQRTTILILCEVLWGDLRDGRHARTLLAFDEVWRFFAHCRSFLEELYRTLRKYRAGIASITQNLADYGDDAFAKMVFTNSFTKIFLQNGASADYLRSTFDLPESDVQRAISVASKKPLYSEFFGLSPGMSQIFRLYPSAELYALANTENINLRKETNE